MWLGERGEGECVCVVGGERRGECVCGWGRMCVCGWGRKEGENVCMWGGGGREHNIAIHDLHSCTMFLSAWS